MAEFYFKLLVGDRQVWPATDIAAWMHETALRLFPDSPMPKTTQPEGVARRFCHAPAEETAGMAPGSSRMVHTIAQRMGITFEEAPAIADDCVRRGWADHRQHTVSLRVEGRQVAAAVRKAIASKRQPPGWPKAARKGHGRNPAK